MITNVINYSGHISSLDNLLTDDPRLLPASKSAFTPLVSAVTKEPLTLSPPVKRLNFHYLIELNQKYYY